MEATYQGASREGKRLMPKGYAQIGARVHPLVKERVIRLKTLLDTTSAAAVIGKSTKILEMLLIHVEEGGVVVLRDKEGQERELFIV